MDDNVCYAVGWFVICPSFSFYPYGLTAYAVCRKDVLCIAVSHNYRVTGAHAQRLCSPLEDLGIRFTNTNDGTLGHSLEKIGQSELL